MADAAEQQARQLLLTMMDRLARGPHEGLGIHQASTPPEIRSAFLELTKTYHPARFGRMSHDVQRLANEVFLSLRTAHDSLAKPARAPARPSPVSTQPMTTARTQPAPVVSRTGTGPVIPRTSTGPLGATRQVPTSSTPPPNHVTVQGSGPRPAPILTSTPPPASKPPSGPLPTMRSSGSYAVQAPAAGASTTSAVRPTDRQPALPKPPITPPVQTSQVPSNVRFATGAVPRAGTAPGTAAGSGAAIAIPTTARTGEPELAPVHDLIGRQQWDAARVNLQALLAKQPASPRYHSLLAYVRGRKAQLEHRVDEARVELDRALQLDPELAAAKSALAELFTRRR